MKTLRGTFQSMHVRNFRLFFVGQLISQCGTWMQTIALGWLVLQLSDNSGFAIGFAIALQFIPTLLFGVWGGVIADRFDKRTRAAVDPGRDGSRGGHCSRWST